MRLWSLHPRYLDAKGLVALWREALLAQKVLRGKTKGYRQHPQLERFKAHAAPEAAIAAYLFCVWEEAERRGYSFTKSKIGSVKTRSKIRLTSGQLKYEFEWLCRKLNKRDRKKCGELKAAGLLKIHPLFRRVPGPIESWEKIK
jgi:hypothetical protein